MKAMVLERITRIQDNGQPLKMTDLPRPSPSAGEVLLRVLVCGVCHTELDEIEGRTAPPELPVVLGHEVVGEVIELGQGAEALHKGDRLGVAWIYSACGHCEYCRSGRENLCPYFEATGRDANGGYAEYMVVPAAYAYPIPENLKDAEAAPLLCAGAVGYRSLRLTGIKDGDTLGLTGFGGSGHLVLKMVKHKFPRSRIYVFARNPDEQAHARELGAVWAGDTADDAPEKLHAIIDTTPAWKPLVEALEQLKPGGRLVINAISKEAGDQDYLQKLNYPKHLWMEKEIKSVANVTRRDVREFLELASTAPIRPDFQEYPLEKANQALLELKQGKIRGAKVLRIADR
jgi:propanol-preferring alcohol dehydrogenase